MVMLASFFFVASAALAFSYDPVPRCLLAACIWFGVSLLAIMLSFLFSARAYRKYIASLDADVVNEDQAGGEAAYVNLWTALTSALNWVSGIALFAGVFSLVYEVIRLTA
jgi:hypothetical protein